MKRLIEDMKHQMGIIEQNIDKNTKASEARVRKATLAFDKLGKRYRKESIAQHK